MSIPEITPAEFIARRQRGDAMTLLDVREEWELGVASVPGSSFFADPADGRSLLRFAFPKKLETLEAAGERLRSLVRS